MHHIQVHIFASRVDIGEESQLDQVIIEVSHIQGDLQFTEIRKTGEQHWLGPGMIEFELHDAAKVRVVLDVGEKTGESDSVMITT